MSKSILLLILVLALQQSIRAQDSTRIVAEGNRFYQEGNYEKAIACYREALQKKQAAQIAHFNLGVALFRAKQTEAAGIAFHAVTVANTPAPLRQKALYNEGVVRARNNQLQESVGAFKKALLLHPSDQEARYNLRKAMELLRQQQPRQSPQNKDKQSAAPPPPANKKMMEQWLQSLRQKEQEVQRKMMNKSRAVTQPEKDW